VQVQVEQLNQKFQKLSSEKLEIQKKLSFVSSDLAEAEAGRSAANIQAEGLKRSLDAAQKVLTNKDDDCEDRIKRVRTEMKKRFEIGLFRTWPLGRCCAASFGGMLRCACRSHFVIFARPRSDTRCHSFSMFICNRSLLQVKSINYFLDCLNRMVL